MHLTVVGESPTARLELRVVEPGHPLAGGRGVAADLLALDTTSGAGRSQKSPLARAVGLGRSGRRRRRGRGSAPASDVPDPPDHADPGPPSTDAQLRVLDATAGLGEDAWLLAAAGCLVTAVERQPIVHALLTDALRRAAEVQPQIAARLHLLPAQDAADLLRRLAEREPEREPDRPAAAAGQPEPAAHTFGDPGPFDVVLLDPMFPDASKRKTTERKPMRMLRLLAGDDPDAASLWPLAMRVAGQRVVVKRPRRAPTLPILGPDGQAPPPPAAQHEGRGFRFDVYPTAGR